MRLIDGDEAKTKTNIGYFRKMMDECKEIDPVHVAGGCYCRECKYLREPLGQTYCSKSGEYVRIVDLKDNDFCSRGEKKKEEQDG